MFDGCSIVLLSICNNLIYCIPRGFGMPRLKTVKKSIYGLTHGFYLSQLYLLLDEINH